MGGMGEWFTNLFGGRSGNTKQIAPTILGITDTAEGKKYKQTLEDRMAGLGLGFDQSVLDSNTAPYAAQRRASLKEQEIPLISAEASSRGLGRSTIPVNRTALSSQAASRDIEERVAQLVLENERTKTSQKESAIGDYGNLASAVTAGENAKYAAAAEATNANRAANVQAAQRQGQLMASVGDAALSYFGIKSNTASAFTPTQTQQVQSAYNDNALIDAVLKNRQSGAQVNINTGNPYGTNYSSLTKLSGSGGIFN